MLGSCTDLSEELYDRLPADKFPENSIQGGLVSSPVYGPMQDFLDWGGWWFCQEVPSDELVFPTRHTDWDDGGKWRVLHTHTWTNTTEAVESMWSRYYEGIGEANRILESIGESDNEEALRTIAKLKIMRAYYYYLLIDNYGDVPYVTSFSEAPENPEKEDRSVIWNAIVEDVEMGIPYLDESTTKTAVTKGMAYSLLAKLYLNAGVYTGQPDAEYWTAAEAACDSIIESGYYSLETSPSGPFVTENQNSPENIFTIPYDEDTYTGFNLHMRTLHYDHNLTYDMTAGPWNGCAVTESHYNSYSEDDIRKEEWFLVGQQYTSSGQPITDNTAGSPLVLDPNIPALNMDATYTPEEIRMSGARVEKFEMKMGAKANLSNDFPIFRYADVLLMKAETMIRQDENGDQYVNMIRSRAGLDDWTDVTLEMLLEERGRELFFEGHRRQDQIRFGTFNEAWWEKDPSTTDRNTFPIPQWVIDANPNLAD